MSTLAARVLAQNEEILVSRESRAANTCIESTGPLAIEFDYHVTMVTDPTAAYSQVVTHSAHSIHSRVVGYEDEGCFRCSQS